MVNRKYFKIEVMQKEDKSGFEVYVNGERDFEKERESRTGETVQRNLPPELNLSSPNSLNKIRDELNKAVREGYSRDYEDLIRKYYEILQNESLQNH